MFGGLWLVWLVWALLPLLALFIAMRALREARSSRERLAALERRLRETSAEPGALPLPVAAPIEEPPAIGASAATPSTPLPPPPAPPPRSPAPARLDLEQRIGARWATWVGIVAILFAASFFLRWAFEENLIGPGLRVVLGLVAGAALLGAGLALRRRRDLPYLCEGLTGGGLGILYLSLYAAHASYGFLGARPAFGAMLAVTVAGVAVAVLTGRQAIAVLAVLGGLLTPVLVTAESPDERILLGYLVVLDLGVLAIARFRAWAGLNWLAWIGTAALVTPVLLRDAAPTHLVARLSLLSAVFLLFLAVPLAREWSAGARGRDVDLLLVAANAAGYFGAVYVTLEATRPAAEGPYALGLAVLYAALASECRRRMPDDDVSPLIHLGVADVFLTLGIALAMDGPWVTIAWAAQGVVLLSAAPRVVTAAPVWGGVAALLLAALRAVAVDPHWYPEATRELTPADLVHVAVVGCLAWAGALARRVRPEQLRWLSPEGLQAGLWIVASLVASVLVWRETSGLWPCALLAVLLFVLGALSRILREPRAPTFTLAMPLVALVLLVRLFVEDQALARSAAAALVGSGLLVRAGACVAIVVAGLWLARGDAEDGTRPIGRALAAAGALALLIVLSLHWIEHQAIVQRAATRARQRGLVDAVRWQTQVGLSVLWALSAAAALGWGFLRQAAAVRWAGLGLLGVVIGKVFLVDLAAVATAYRIVSFLILGLVLLGVSVLYQKGRRAGQPVAAPSPGP
ncbi:MAG: DUF2339 domain-containing protein [Candidatus Rokuibacteriota bacterium]